MNYMTAEAIGEFKEIIASWQDPAVRACIITGAVPNKYITHYSVEELVDMGGDPVALARSAPDLIYPYHLLLQSLTKLPKPVIAAMSGTRWAAAWNSCSIATSGSSSTRTTSSAFPRWPSGS